MSGTKQRIVDLLRKARLLPLADRVMLLGSVLRNHRANRRFLAAHPGHAVPPPSLAFDAYNHTNWQLYHEMGLLHARLVAAVVREHLPQGPLRICEWGCGPARVVRHLKAMLSGRQVELVGTDYNPRSIAWCRQNVRGIEFVDNGLQPPLPFDTNAFDCLYALSVFTHLSEEAHLLWIRELLRVVRPAGILLLTTHGDACTGNLLPDERKQYQEGHLVVRGEVEVGKKCFVAFHPPAFIRHRLLADAEVAEVTEVADHLPSPQNYGMIQDVWVVRKKSPSP
jgi:SAM-dependent methyltransferase